MNTFSKTILAAAMTLSLASAGHAQDWTLDSEASKLSFGSVKSDRVGEVHSFEQIEGRVSSSGDVKLDIDLASVNTFIEIRDERMIEHLFGGGTTATLTAKIDMSKLSALEVGETKTLFLDGSFSFLDRDVAIDTEVFVARLTESRVLVTTSDMIFLGTEDLGIDDGIVTLIDIMSLSGITRTAPVTFRLVFHADDTEAGAVTPDSIGQAEVQHASLEGDPDAGRSVYRGCQACHTLTEGNHRVGPSLYGIFGATAGQVEGFRYSPAMADSGLVWTTETLTAFLTDPRGFMPGNRMAYRGLNDETDMKDLLAFLARETAVN